MGVHFTGHAIPLPTCVIGAYFHGGSRRTLQLVHLCASCRDKVKNLNWTVEGKIEIHELTERTNYTPVRCAHCRIELLKYARCNCHRQIDEDQEDDFDSDDNPSPSDGPVLPIAPQIF